VLVSEVAPPSTIPLLVRAAAVHEAPELTELSLRSKAHWGYDAEFMSAAREELTVQEDDIRTAIVVVAESRGRLVGFYALALDQGSPELTAMFVEPELIGQGVGRALMRHALDTASQSGVDSLLIESDPNAEAFYRSQGAVPIGQRRSRSTGRVLPLLRIPTR
jgi:GNAT superfamily N-acetyltransferase